ncbi:MAG: hypothetical protein ACRDJC_05365 [Thermomicrobiales bacterium]
MEERIQRFKIPTDDDARLWRYMRMNRFNSMLVTGSAYFCRLDRLEDQFESALSPRALDAAVEELAREGVARCLLPAGVDPYDAAYLATGSGDALDRASIFVNCWQKNPHESWAMWKQFARDGVAIRSTVGRLVDSFNPEGTAPRVFPGEVEYIDHETDEMLCPFPWLYKNHMFGWEQEVRAWTVQKPREHSIVGFNEDHPEGLNIRVDLSVLVDGVVVLPGSNEETRQNVQILLAENGLPDKPVLASAADTIPEYRQYHNLNRQSLLEMGIDFPIHRDEEESD